MRQLLRGVHRQLWLPDSAGLHGSDRRLLASPRGAVRAAALHETVLDARDRSANTAAYDNQLPFQPRYRGYLRPELGRVPLPAGLELGAYVDAEARAHDFEDPANLLDLQTRLLLGCGVTLGVPRARLRVTASGVNLTNTQRVDITNWILPGRAFFVALAYAPVGAEGGSGSAIFDPRYGQ